MSDLARPPAAPVADGVARWLSILGHPFVSSTVMVFGAGLRRGGAGAAWRAVLAVAAVALAPVAVLMMRQVRRGAWTHVDASNRRERPLLYAVGLASLGILLALVSARDPGSFLVRGALGAVALLLVAGLATVWIKVSLHTAFAAMAAAVLAAVGSPLGWPMVVAVPAVGWSRLRLGRHRPVEVVLGGLMGLAAGVAVRYV